jgi:hypothetical protein
MTHPQRPILLLIGFGIVLVVSGCSRDAKITDLPDGEKNLRIIFRAYTNAAQKLGHSPKNVEELKPFLQEYGNPDDFLTSPNDGKPYVIVPNLDLHKPKGNPVVAFERDGKNGQRLYIALSSISVQTATDEEFAKLTIPPELKANAGVR